MLILNKADRIVGEISYFKGMDYQVGYEVGYQIYLKSDRGKGYMSEALEIFSAYLFKLKPITRLQLNLIKNNIGSRKVAERCGYKHEGTMRRAVFNRGKYHDLELFSLLKEEVESGLFEV